LKTSFLLLSGASFIMAEARFPPRQNPHPVLGLLQVLL
jgi:hypothetical protein